jgi:hypothetical protein
MHTYIYIYMHTHSHTHTCIHACIQVAGVSVSVTGSGSSVDKALVHGLCYIDVLAPAAPAVVGNLASLRGAAPHAEDLPVGAAMFKSERRRGGTRVQMDSIKSGQNDRFKALQVLHFHVDDHVYWLLSGFGVEI